MAGVLAAAWSLCVQAVRCSLSSWRLCSVMESALEVFVQTVHVTRYTIRRSLPLFTFFKTLKDVRKDRPFKQNLKVIIILVVLVAVVVAVAAAL